MNPFIAIQPKQQQVALLPRLFKIGHMADMQQIKTAIRDYEPLSAGFDFFTPTRQFA